MQPKESKRVLILSEHFAPAYKAGGIVRSLENLVIHLSSEYEFFILTSNNNLDKEELLNGVEHDAWVSFTDKTNVFYTSPQKQKFKTIKSVIENVQPDIIYINGLYSVFFTLKPLWLTKYNRPKPVIILAPWGMLHHGCLSIKPLKKKIYFHFFSLLGFSKYVKWHATNLQEQNDIFRMFGSKVNVTVADALPSQIPPSLNLIEKTDCILRLVTVSLVAKKKGHLRVIKALKELQNEINAEYHIYGPVKDASFWQACLEEISGMSNSIKVIYHGFLEPSEVFSVIQQHHFFVLHSDGENFCQAIYEALATGRPVITSDQTPWNELQKHKAGWNVQVDDLPSLKRTIKKAYLMKQPQYNELCRGAKEKAKKFVVGLNMQKQYDTLFQ